jgi:hypothetical protein
MFGFGLRIYPVKDLSGLASQENRSLNVVPVNITVCFYPHVAWDRGLNSHKTAYFVH